MAARKWTRIQRETQRKAISRWKPWDSSTGPRTLKGKTTSARNSFRHGCYSRWVSRLRKMERDIRRSGSATVSAIKELETYRLIVESRIAGNALSKRDPKILVRAFGFLSAEISRAQKTVLRDLGFGKDLSGGPGAFVRRFEWEMAKVRAISSFRKNPKSEQPFEWVEVKIPGNGLVTDW